jgi:hypothetical protein
MPVAEKLTDEEVMERLPAVPEGAPFRITKVTTLFDPHPYTIGSKHVAHAADNHSGMLGDYAIRSGEKLGIKCCQPGCNLSYDDHKSDRAVMIEIAADAPEDLNEVEGLHAYLLECKELAESCGIDGFAFPRAKA